MHIGKQLDTQMAYLHYCIGRNVLSISRNSSSRLEGKAPLWSVPNEVNQDNIGSIASNYSLMTGQLFPKSESLFVVSQGQVVPTRKYLKHVDKDPLIQTGRSRYG